MLQLLQLHGLVLQPRVAERLGRPDIGEVGDRQEQANADAVVIQLLDVQRHAATGLALAVEVHLAGPGLGLSGDGVRQERTQSGRIPLAFAQVEQRPSPGLGGDEAERKAERGARRDHLQLAVQQQGRRVGRGDQSQRQALGDLRMHEGERGHGWPFRGVGGSRCESLARRLQFREASHPSVGAADITP